AAAGLQGGEDGLVPLVGERRARGTLEELVVSLPSGRRRGAGFGHDGFLASSRPPQPATASGHASSPAAIAATRAAPRVPASSADALSGTASTSFSARPPCVPPSRHQWPGSACQPTVIPASVSAATAARSRPAGTVRTSASAVPQESSSSPA